MSKSYTNLIFICLLGLTFNTNAALVTYFDRPSWEAALTGTTNEDFSAATSDIVLSPSPTIFGDLTLSTSVFTSYVSTSSTIKSSSYLELFALFPSDYVEIMFSSAGAAIGFDYDPGDAGGDPLNVYINNTFVTALSNSLSAPPTFFGVIDNTNTAINSLKFASSNTGMFARVNVISWSSSSAVPIPSAVWLFGSGLIGLIAVSRRKT